MGESDVSKIHTYVIVAYSIERCDPKDVALRQKQRVRRDGAQGAAAKRRAVRDVGRSALQGDTAMTKNYKFSNERRREVVVAIAHHFGIDKLPSEGGHRLVRMSLFHRDGEGHESAVAEWEEQDIYGESVSVDTLVDGVELAACRDAAYRFGDEVVYVLVFRVANSVSASRFFFKVPGGQEVQALEAVAKTFEMRAASERAAIVADLRAGAGEVRARGTSAWEEAIMPIYRELADRYERGEHLKKAR